jgi:hypothetical protein
LIRVIERHHRPFILWLDDIEALKFVAEVLRRLGIPFEIPRHPPEAGCNSIKILCRRGDSGPPESTSLDGKCVSRGERIAVDCSLVHRSRLGFAMEILRGVVGGVREAVLGVDLGLRRSAMALVAAGGLVYSRTTPRVDDILREICAVHAPELVIGVGYTPVVAAEAVQFTSSVQRCGYKAFIVDEFKSNDFKAYGLKGIDSRMERDVLAAVQIALRVYESLRL